MDPKLEGKLIVAISSRALFNLDDAHRVFEEEPLERYRAHQIERENEPLQPGTGFPLVQGLLSINHRAGQELVEVVLVSRNDADTGLRVMNSVEAYDLPISRAVFTDGRPPYVYLDCFASHLFLSANRDDVTSALNAGFAAGLVFEPPFPFEKNEEEVRIAFDGDAVLFSPEAEETFRRDGLEVFHEQEKASADVPMNPGPFKGFLEALHAIQQLFPAEACPIRTALVTARSAPAHKRAIKTLRAWDVRVNESFFMGGVQKKGVLEKFRPHIFFDDQPSYCLSAAPKLPTAQVLSSVDGETEPSTEMVEPAKARQRRVNGRSKKSAGRSARPRRTRKKAEG